MPVAAAIAGAAVISGATTLIAGGKAANAQKDAAAQQVAEQQREYDQSRSDLAPQRNVGYGAIGKLASMYGVTPTDANGQPVGTVNTSGAGYANDGGYSASPGYAFQLSEGVKAAQRSAAARGSLASGGTMKAITRYATGLAANDYDQYANRLAQLAGFGQTATGQTVAAGQNASNNITSAIGAAGNARASSYANTGSAINGTVGNLASAYLYSKGGYGGNSGSSYSLPSNFFQGQQVQGFVGNDDYSLG